MTNDNKSTSQPHSKVMSIDHLTRGGADQYQKNAARTIAPQHYALRRMDTASFHEEQRKGFPNASGVHPPANSGAMLLHGLIGAMGEMGELGTAVEHYMFYNKDFDRNNAIEEIGDLLWYVAEMCTALDMSMAQVMDMNIAKLRKRFPHQFDEGLAKEENRDRPAEQKAANQVEVEDYKSPQINTIIGAYEELCQFEPAFRKYKCEMFGGSAGLVTIRGASPSHYHTALLFLEGYMRGQNPTFVAVPVMPVVPTPLDCNPTPTPAQTDPLYTKASQDAAVRHATQEAQQRAEDDGVDYFDMTDKDIAALSPEQKIAKLRAAGISPNAGS